MREHYPSPTQALLGIFAAMFVPVPGFRVLASQLAPHAHGLNSRHEDPRGWAERWDRAEQGLRSAFPECGSVGSRNSPEG